MGLMVLDILAHHPSRRSSLRQARHKVCHRPIQRSSSRSYRNRFHKSDGDIRATLRSVFTSPEFIAPDSFRGNQDAIRACSQCGAYLGGETNGGPGFHQWIARMASHLWLASRPTVYPDTALDWVNPVALLSALNFGLALANIVFRVRASILIAFRRMASRVGGQGPNDGAFHRRDFARRRVA